MKLQALPKIALEELDHIRQKIAVLCDIHDNIGRRQEAEKVALEMRDKLIRVTTSIGESSEVTFSPKVIHTGSLKKDFFIEIVFQGYKTYTVERIKQLLAGETLTTGPGWNRIIGASMAKSQGRTVPAHVLKKTSISLAEAA